MAYNPFISGRKQLVISDEAKNGEWKGAGMYGNVILGIQYGVASSALQKAIRRGYDNEAIQWALAMYWNGGAAVTNVWNRMLVMTVEDIGPANTLALPVVYHLYTSKVGQEEYRLALAAAYLAQSPKSRINDWACYRYMADKDGIKDLRQYYQSYVKALEKKDINAILKHITNLAFCEDPLPKDLKKELGVKVNYAQSLIWQGFYDVITKSDYLDLVYDVGHLKTWISKAERKGKSRLLYSHIAILWALSEMPTDEQSRYRLKYKDNVNYIKSRVEDVRRFKNLLGVPDYVYDKHTRQGKALGRGYKHFIEEASKLNNESQEWNLWSKYFLSYFVKNMATKE